MGMRRRGRECWGQVSLLWARRSAPDLRRLKDNLREIRRMMREHMLTERMRDAMKRANCSKRDSEGEINGKKDEGRAGCD